MPASTPAVTVNIASVTTIRRTAGPVAPSAIRIAISRDGTLLHAYADHAVPQRRSGDGAPPLMLLRQALPGGVPWWQPWAGMVGVIAWTVRRAVGLVM